jgi:CheY-like chemotaxis protein
VAEVSRLALIVRPGCNDDHLAAALESVGYVVIQADSFFAARARLTEDVQLLITDLRLGEYNGLHLVLVAKHQHPKVLAIVAAETADDVLQREARSMARRTLCAPSASRIWRERWSSSSDRDQAPLCRSQAANLWRPRSSLRLTPQC